MARPRWFRPLARSAAYTAFLLVIAEGTARGALRLAEQGPGLHIPRTPEIYAQQSRGIRALLGAGPATRDVYDDRLGWRYRANYRGAGERINAQGLRSDREYAPAPRPGVLRVAAFGDSFVYGTEVANPDTWTAQMEARDPRVEVLNYGVGGYGSDQALLRYQAEGRALRPRVVVIGFFPDMLRRTTNVYRRFISPWEVPVAKPRFVLERGGELRLLPVPLRAPEGYARLLQDPAAVRALGRHDQWYERLVYENPLYDRSAAVRLIGSAWMKVHNRLLDPERLLDGRTFNTAAPAFRLQVRLLEEFAARVRADGAEPLIVVFPDQTSLRRAMRGREVVYAPLVRELRGRSLPVVDLAPAFLARGSDADLPGWFMDGGHYSGAGNAIVAERLLEELPRHVPTGD